jgi:MYXO-CTERM domain-containing protein
MKHTMRCASLSGMAGLMLALPASAHPGHGESGMLAVLLHVLTEPDHLLALLALPALLAAVLWRWRRRRERKRAAPSAGSGLPARFF